MSRRLLPLALVVTGLLLVPSAAPAVAPNPNPWLDRHFLNIAHQGGEDEAPSATMFALRTAIVDRGADMLELDVQLTSDGHLVVIHDDTVSRTTNGSQTRATAQIRDMTLAQVQALDAAYWFRPNSQSHNPSIPPEEFIYRGIRTGDKPPPPGYSAGDFRVPTLKEVLDAFPNTPINIEIKQPKICDGSIECDALGLLGINTATALAEMLDRPEYASRDDIIVVSFSDVLLLVFNAADAPPKVALAPGLVGIAAYALTGLPPIPDAAAFQVPPEQYGFRPPELLLGPGGQDAHGDGYAVHVWPTGAEPDGEDSYARLMAMGIDGYMSSQPSRLHAFLCANEVPRPDGSDRCPDAVPGAGTPPAVAPASAVAGARRKCGKRKKLRRGKCVRKKKRRQRRGR